MESLPQEGTTSIRPKGRVLEGAMPRPEASTSPLETRDSVPHRSETKSRERKTSIRPKGRVLELIKMFIYCISFKMNVKKHTIYPITDDLSWSYYKKAVASFWTAEEIDLSKDLEDWNNLTNDEKNFIKNILAFFASSDILVNDNLAERFLNEDITLEAKCFYGFQIAIENIHNETYSLLIDTYIKDTNEKTRLFNSIENNKYIKMKAEYCNKYQRSDLDFIYRIVAFACVEGIFFSSSFCSIYWLKKRGLMAGLTFSNELISRDESLHTEFAIEMFKKYFREIYNKDLILKIITEATELEINFVKDCLKVDLIGMNSNLLCDYVKFVSDRLLVQLGFNKKYNVSNPCDWMERISLIPKTSFFESRNSQYSKASIANAMEGSEGFNITDDF
jgi:ribonucleotide reductase beta subunit family protein with ferritin-like domain